MGAIISKYLHSKTPLVNAKIFIRIYEDTLSEDLRNNFPLFRIMYVVDSQTVLKKVLTFEKKKCLKILQ